MERELIRQHSDNLDRDMRVLRYGDGGHPVVVFETQDSMCESFEDFGMIDALSDLIEGGRIQLFCLDSVDAESWSDTDGDPTWRAARQEQYFRYVTDEVLPLVHDRNASQLRPLAMGCSMGATHSVICALRRPDLFQGCVALSGVYDASFFFGSWSNETLYYNNPCAFLPEMPADHPYVRLYNERQLVLCVGQGAFEEEGVRTLRVLDEAFRAKGVHAWCDYWGFDVNHDWPWWKRQARYFLPIVLDDMARQQAAGEDRG